MMRLVIIGIRKTGTSLALVNAALSRGIDVTIISNPEDRIDGVFSSCVVIKYMISDVSFIINWIKENYPTPQSTLRITTLNDVYACITAQVSSALNLPGPDVFCVSRAVSKHQQKKILVAKKIPTPEFREFNLSNIEKKEAMLGQLEFPIVIKPSEGTASNGVKRCTLYSEVFSHLDFLADQKKLRPDLIPSDIVLLENYLPGTEYCVEYFDGNYVGAIRKSKRFGNDFFERGYTSELDMDEKALRNLIETGSRAVEAAGLNWGPVHIDCIVNDGLAGIIELNPRIAGSFICDIIHDAYSFDMVDHLLNKLQEKDVTVPVKFLPDAYACVIFFLESDPLPWKFAESGELKNDIIHITYGPQHLRNRSRRAYVYIRNLMRNKQLEND